MRPDDRRIEENLPARLYVDAAVFQRERETLLREAWQVVGHESDLPQPGDYLTFDVLGESVLTVRGEDGAVRSFHNACRHRASRLTDAAAGNCGRRLTCPYHAWSYQLDGRIARIPPWQGFAGLDPDRIGLAPVEQEIWRGFVFVRFKPGLPSVAEMMAPVDAEVAGYRLEDLKPRGAPVLRPRPVNWKNVGDNYADALHIPVAHPGLSRLFAGSYGLEALGWVDRMSGRVCETPSPNWSEAAYQALLPAFDHLPEANRRLWLYYRLWPNTAFDIYPDQVDFMQFLPVSANETLVREISYAWPDERREVRAARYLNWRINRQVNAEDTALIARVQAGMSSSGYVSGPISPAEPCLAAFARRYRERIGDAPGDAPVEAPLDRAAPVRARV